MKRMFLALVLASATSLFALSNESLSYSRDVSFGRVAWDPPVEPTIPSEGLESKFREIHRRHSHHQVVDSIAYGSFYTENGITVSIEPPFPPGSSIILNQISVARNVTLLAGSIVRLDEPGDYAVDFGISATALGIEQIPITIGLALNGVSQPGSSISNKTSGGLFSGSTIVRVLSAPAYLTLVNQTDEDIALGTLTPGDVTAFVTVHKLSHPSP